MAGGSFSEFSEFSEGPEAEVSAAIEFSAAEVSETVEFSETVDFSEAVEVSEGVEAVASESRFQKSSVRKGGMRIGRRDGRSGPEGWNIMDYAQILESEEYSFLREDVHLGRHVILLGLGGSYSYGTNHESSDTDVRGVTLNRRSDLIGLTKYEQYVDDHTDTVIYAFQKMITLLVSCNPNTLELLGLNREHYLYLNHMGRELVERAGMFLSKRAIQSFGGYADAQLRRLQNAMARDEYPQSDRERHIFNSVKNAMYDFRRRYERFEEGSLKLYIDKAVNPEFDTEIFVDVSLRHYPLRDYKNLWNEMHNIVKDYDKLGKRNKKKDDNHLNKHAMHLVRLFMMAIDILERGEINTFRRQEHDLLMSIRRGDYRSADGGFSSGFYEIVGDYEKRLEEAARRTRLPEEPDMEEIQKYVMQVNERVVRDEI